MLPYEFHCDVTVSLFHHFKKWSSFLELDIVATRIIALYKIDYDSLNIMSLC